MNAPGLSPSPRKIRLKRLLKQTVLVLLIFGIWLGVGMLGYHHLDHCNWVDSFFYAALLIADEGPNYAHKTDEGKIFVGIFSLCNMVIFLSTASVIMAPALRRGVEMLHLSDDENKEPGNNV